MGIRVYPNTKNHDVLERIIGVPAGTWQKYLDKQAEIDAKKTEMRERGDHFADISEWAWNAMQDAEHGIASCDNFDTFGWGRMGWQPEKYHEDGCLSPGGGTNDPHEVFEIIARNGIDLGDAKLEELEGVGWC